MENLIRAATRGLIFVGGKGGVGKTSVSLGLARALARLKPEQKILWVQIENPLLEAGQKTTDPKFPNLTHLNCEASTAFEEYAGIKIGIPALTRIFVRNSFVSYLSKASPGIHELVLLGKIWYEREHYAHVIVDMPSTGYGLAMFQSTKNFSQLFSGGPFYEDSIKMLKTFSDPQQTGQILVALPEEMPLVETLELEGFLLRLFPGNAPSLVLNRSLTLTTQTTGSPPRETLPSGELENPETWTTLTPRDLLDYLDRRIALEQWNLQRWKDRDYARLPYLLSDQLEPQLIEQTSPWLYERSADESRSSPESKS